MRLCYYSQFLLACSTLGCSPGAFPAPETAHVAKAQEHWPDTDLAELENGRKLYLGRCGSCHRPFDPTQLTADEWPEAVLEMQEQAKLDEAQVQAITRYIVTLRERTP